MGLVDAFGPKIGDYIVEGELGRGASAILLKARHDVLDDQVALKVLREGQHLDSLRREARILHKLQHPAIITLRAVSLESQPPYLALDLIDGPSLKERLDEKTPLAIPEALEIVLAILSGLEELHAQGFVHGDIKPANILLGSHNEVKIIDFAFSSNRAENDELELSADLADGQPKKRWGTYAYAAPELVKGEELDGRADLYSLGIVLFEMLTGQRPEPGDKPSDLRAELPSFLDEVFIQCYCRKDKRLSSASAMAALLRPYAPETRPDRALADEPDLALERLGKVKKLMEAGALEEAEEALETLKPWANTDPHGRALSEELNEIQRKVLNSRNKEELRTSLGEYDELLALLKQRLGWTPRDKALAKNLGQLEHRLQKRAGRLERARQKHDLGETADARALLEESLEELPGDRLCRQQISEFELDEKRVSLVLEAAQREGLSDAPWRLGQVQKLLKERPQHRRLLEFQRELREHIEASQGRRSPWLVVLVLVIFVGGLFLAGSLHAQSSQQQFHALLEADDIDGAKQHSDHWAFFVPWFTSPESSEKMKKAWDEAKARQKSRRDQRKGAGESAR